MNSFPAGNLQLLPGILVMFLTEKNCILFVLGESLKYPIIKKSWKLYLHKHTIIEKSRLKVICLIISHYIIIMDSLTKSTAGGETELRFYNKIYCLKFISHPVLTVSEHRLPLSPLLPLSVLSPLSMSTKVIFHF